ncbi:hypothetical protein AMJ44_08250 [candidate division WOR-1 bacterium DG_54_3]|uniref:Uncharacterized protein n=1 Tax=candidate division WOR-1 bacterium DG_54_3 TaxID=1703775 RepID=A0A0S7XVQ3_UNCSA|nr:MAG: hypothetical protein AMJ44_08250 [candidate division WOR-1 bacterium DG_54_3]
MQEQKSVEVGNWGTWLVNTVIHPFAVTATPLFVLVLMIYLVYYAFLTGTQQGIRSFSGVLLPLILVTFLYIFQRDLLRNMGKIPTTVSFLISLIIGLLVMTIVRVIGHSSSIPITELVLSGSFSILVFSYVSLLETKMFSYYYGMISGFLIYLFFFGFPVNL